jgi:hypothetical protein
MTTLIIPDIHNHTDEVDAVLAANAADQIILLGDYFDSFFDTPEMAEKTARWLKHSLEQPNRIHLWGNHDLPYAFPSNKEAFCPGFSEEKCDVVQNILTEAHWAMLKPVHFITPRLCVSHAGFIEPLFKPEAGAIQRAMTQAMSETRKNESSLMTHEVGPLWVRWDMLPVMNGISQIVGHTPGPLRMETNEMGDFNVCLDTHGQYIGLILDDEFVVREVDSDGVSVAEAGRFSLAALRV